MNKTAPSQTALIRTAARRSVRDEQIVNCAKERLREAAFLMQDAVSCGFYEGVLVLRGTLPSFYLKQLAQSATVRVDGVKEVVNRIQVVPPKNSPDVSL